MFKSIMPNLMVENVNETVDFYVNKLHFNLVVSMPIGEEKFEFAIVAKDEVTISFQLKESLVSEYPELEVDIIKPSLSLYIVDDNLENTYNEIKNQVKIIKKPHLTPYGIKEFALLDLNNNVLTISQQ